MKLKGNHKQGVRSILVAAGITLAVSLPAVSDETRPAETKGYTAGLGAVWVEGGYRVDYGQASIVAPGPGASCGDSPLAQCFRLEGEQSIRIDLEDHTGMAVAGSFSFRDGLVDFGGGSFCGSTTVAVPEGATKVIVFVEDELCEGPATHGSLTVSFDPAE